MVIKYSLRIMRNFLHKLLRLQSGFSLAEMLVALMIGAMILVTVLGILSRAQRSAAAVTTKLDRSRLPSEIIQRIAEDFDGILSSGSGTRIVVSNRMSTQGYSTARLEIIKTVYDSENKPQTFEKIIWQAGYDFDSDDQGLVLYRSHSGIDLEDRLLEKSRVGNREEELFVPICSGVTLFRIQLPGSEGELGDEKKLLDQWNAQSLPHGIIVTISFSEPFRTIEGTLEVPEKEKFIRTIAIDRTRNIPVKFIATEVPKADKGDVKNTEKRREDQIKELIQKLLGVQEDIEIKKEPEEAEKTKESTEGTDGNDIRGQE